MRFLPQRITSKLDPEFARFLDNLLDRIRRVTPRSSATVRVKESAQGTTFEVLPAAAAGGGTGNVVWDPNPYDPTKSYKAFTMLRCQTNAGGASQGVWIAVKDAPAGTVPTFPEPATTGGVTTWQMVCFGVQASVDCQNGNKVIFINASAPVV